MLNSFKRIENGTYKIFFNIMLEYCSVTSYTIILKIKILMFNTMKTTRYIFDFIQKIVVFEDIFCNLMSFF